MIFGTTKKNKNLKQIITGFYICLFTVLTSITIFNTDFAFSQQTEKELEIRLQNVENYVATIQPTIVELSDALNKSIEEYTQGLESSLEIYSKMLQVNLDERLRNIDRKSIIINPYTRAYQNIETNTGNFLIAVERVEPIENGSRLHLNIGNPNYADYQNFTLKFIWGGRWAGNNTTP